MRKSIGNVSSNLVTAARSNMAVFSVSAPLFVTHLGLVRCVGGGFAIINETGGENIAATQNYIHVILSHMF